jgi:hypothetical protein
MTNALACPGEQRLTPNVEGEGEMTDIYKTAIKIEDGNLRINAVKGGTYTFYLAGKFEASDTVVA